MQRLNRPISLRTLWCGIEGGNATVRLSSMLLGRFVILAGAVLLAGFILAMLVFEFLLLIHDPIVAVSTWLVVGVIALLMRRGGRRTDPPPGRFLGGPGCPVPSNPTPLMVVGATCSKEADERIAASGD